jgi:hypothetical protein
MLRTSTRMSTGAGYSLDDAARIRQAVQAGAAGGCPHCAFPLDATVGKDGEREVWLVRCHGCGRSLVIRRGMGARTAG